MRGGVGDLCCHIEECVLDKDSIIYQEHRLLQVGVNLESVELFCLVVLAA